MTGRQADAVVAAVEPGLTPPAVRAVAAVLVTGPSQAGVTGMVTALRDRMPEHVFVEKLPPAEAPAAVVFVVSAAAVMTESDCVTIDSATVNTDLVIAVVSKTDAYRAWREMLTADRAVLAARSRRYESVPWVGAAAAPDLGAPRVDELAGVLRERLADPLLGHRNRLRAWESHLQALTGGCRGDGVDRRARVAVLHRARDDIARGRRTARAEHTAMLHAELRQARVRLGHVARNRCASLRAELAGDVSMLSRRRLRGFEAQVRRRVAAAIGAVDDGITEQLIDAAERLGLPAVPVPEPPSPPVIESPSLRSRRLETQLTTILGAGFGLGVALVAVRLLEGLAGGPTGAGQLAGGLAGLALTAWVAAVRGLLQDRAVLDRWVVDATTTLRYAIDERLATRMLAAETVLTAAAGMHDRRESAAVQERLAAIDVELRRHAVQLARAAVLRERRLPPLQRALDAVRAERDRVTPRCCVESASIVGAIHPEVSESEVSESFL